MHIHVLGFGAVGTLVSYHLRAALDPKHLVTVIHKNSVQAHRANQRGVIRYECEGVALSQRDIQHESHDPYSDIVHSNIESERKRQRTRNLPKEVQEQQLANLPTDVQATQIESLIVALKAPFAVGGIKNLLPRLSRDSTIVLLHNGMGVYEDLLRRVFRNREERPNIVVSTNNHGAWLKETGHVVHSGVGDIKLGIMPDLHGRDFEARLDTSLPEDQQQLDLADITPLDGEGNATLPRYRSLRNTIDALTSVSALNVSWQPVYDVQIALRRKLVVNCVINPLTALLDCRNGVLLEHRDARALCESVCHEAARLFRTQWHNETGASLGAAADSGTGAAEEARTLEWEARELFPQELTAQALIQECERVMSVTRNNVSSMLIDVRRGSQTEIEYLNGYLVKLAHKHDVEVPTIRSLYELVRLRTRIPMDMPVPLNSVL